MLAIPLLPWVQHDHPSSGRSLEPERDEMLILYCVIASILIRYFRLLSSAFYPKWNTCEPMQLQGEAAKEVRRLKLRCGPDERLTPDTLLRGSSEHYISRRGRPRSPANRCAIGGQVQVIFQFVLWTWLPWRVSIPWWRRDGKMFCSGASRSTCSVGFALGTQLLFGRSKSLMKSKLYGTTLPTPPPPNQHPVPPPRWREQLIKQAIHEIKQVPHEVARLSAISRAPS